MVKLWTVKQTAEFLHLSQQAVRKALKLGKLKGKKFGHIWMIRGDLFEEKLRGKNDSLET